MTLGAYTHTHTFVDKRDYKKPGARRPLLAFGLAKFERRTLYYVFLSDEFLLT